jgi:hypothetical protein
MLPSATLTIDFRSPADTTASRRKRLAPSVRLAFMSTEQIPKIVAALVKDGLIQPDQSARAEESVRTALAEKHAVRATGMPKLIEVVAYLGAALVVAAVFLLLMQEWPHLSETEQVLALGIVTLILAVAGGVAAFVGNPSRQDDIRRRLTSTLLTSAALGAGVTVGRWVDTVVPTDYEQISWPVVAGAGVVIVLAALVYVLAPSAFGQVAILGGAITGMIALTDTLDSPRGIVLGSVLTLLGAIWVLLAERGLLREVMIGRAFGVATLLLGAQFPVLDGHHNWYGYVLTLVVVVICVLFYLAKIAWPYVAGAVVGITFVVPEAVTDWTDGSLGVVGGVLIAGVALLVASFVGYRLRVSASHQQD